MGIGLAYSLLARSVISPPLTLHASCQHLAAHRFSSKHISTRRPDPLIRQCWCTSLYACLPSTEISLCSTPAVHITTPRRHYPDWYLKPADSSGFEKQACCYPALRYRRQLSNFTAARSPTSEYHLDSWWLVLLPDFTVDHLRTT